MYVHELLDALVSKDTCLNTTAAAAAVNWLNASQADPAYSGSVMWTWLVFQVQCKNNNRTTPKVDHPHHNAPRTITTTPKSRP